MFLLAFQGKVYNYIYIGQCNIAEQKARWEPGNETIFNMQHYPSAFSNQQWQPYYINIYIFQQQFGIIYYASPFSTA